MILLYRLLFLPAFLLALPYYAIRMWRRGGYGKDFQHRLGCFHRLEPTDEGKLRIWLQAVSVGEVLAVGPLIQGLQQSGRVEIVLTTTTSTGYAEAIKRYTGQVESIGLFPLDFWLFSRLAWQRIQPDVIVLTESELWPEHLHQAKKRGTPAYLVNARMSDKSFGRYQRIPTLALRLLSAFKAIYAASEHDAARLTKLGLSTNRIRNDGSIKLDVPLPVELDAQSLITLRSELGFAPAKDKAAFILLGSSTWPGEESILIGITKCLRAEGFDLRLLLVPRHAERGPEIRRLLEQQDLPWQQRSKGSLVNLSNVIYLADTTGELSLFTQIADLAFIGKSLPPNLGGQSPIDAAGLGIPLLMGPNMNNFRSIAASLIEEDAAQRVTNALELEAAIRSLLSDPSKCTAMSRAGRIWHQRNRGSSARIAAHILQDLYGASSPSSFSNSAITL